MKAGGIVLIWIITALCAASDANESSSNLAADPKMPSYKIVIFHDPSDSGGLSLFKKHLKGWMGMRGRECQVDSSPTSTKIIDRTDFTTRFHNEVASRLIALVYKGGLRKAEGGTSPTVPILEIYHKTGAAFEHVATASYVKPFLAEGRWMSPEEFLAQEIARQLILVEISKDRTCVDNTFKVHAESPKYDFLGYVVPDVITGQLSNSNRISVFNPLEATANPDTSLGKHRNTGTKLEENIQFCNRRVTGSVSVFKEAVHVICNYIDLESGKIRFTFSSQLLLQSPRDNLYGQLENMGERMRSAMEKADGEKSDSFISLMVVSMKPGFSDFRSRSEAEAVRIGDVLTKKLKQVYHTGGYSGVSVKSLANDDEARGLMERPEELGMKFKELGVNRALKIRYGQMGTEFNLDVELVDLRQNFGQTKYWSYNMSYGNLTWILDEIVKDVDRELYRQPSFDSLMRTGQKKQDKEKPRKYLEAVRKKQFSNAHDISNLRFRHSLTATTGIIRFDGLIGRWGATSKVFLGESSSSFYDIWYTHFLVEVWPGKIAGLFAFDVYVGWNPGGADYLPDSLGGDRIYNWALNAMGVPKLHVTWGSWAGYLGAGFGVMGVRRVIEGSRNDHEGDVLWGFGLRAGMEVEIFRNVFINFGTNYFQSVETEDRENKGGPFDYFPAGKHGGHTFSAGLGYHW